MALSLYYSEQEKKNDALLCGLSVKGFLSAVIAAEVMFPTSGSHLDPHRGLHNGVRSHVRQDLESACHFQECQDEEEGELVLNLVTSIRKPFFIVIIANHLRTFPYIVSLAV